MRKEYWKYVGLAVLAIVATVVAVYALSYAAPPMIDPKVFR